MARWIPWIWTSKIYNGNKYSLNNTCKRWIWFVYCCLQTWLHDYMYIHRNIRLTKGKLRGEMSHAVSLCKICNFVFWKVSSEKFFNEVQLSHNSLSSQSYGHPCCTAANSTGMLTVPGDDKLSGHAQNTAKNTQGLTAEQFLHLFVS